MFEQELRVRELHLRSELQLRRQLRLRPQLQLRCQLQLQAGAEALTADLPLFRPERLFRTEEAPPPC